jgi:catechol 2,3-dioxygenase-like lactoylglutathione lyase family enzyme
MNYGAIVTRIMGRRRSPRLDHVNIEVASLVRTRRFHDRFLPALGFRRLPRLDSAWLGYRNGSMTLWFTVSRPRRAIRAAPHVPVDGAEDPISDHLAFRVSSPAGVRAIESVLRRRGIAPVYGFDKVATRGSLWYISAAWRDPDNNVFEVYSVTRRRPTTRD